MLANPSILPICQRPYAKDIKLSGSESADHIEYASLTLQDLSLNDTANAPLPNYAALHSLNQTSSPLLRLPQELRDIIIDHVVSSSPHPLDAYSTHLPPLLQTCTQLRAETASIYYPSKLLMAGGAPSPSYEKHFFDGFDPAHLQFLRRVHWLYESFGTREDAMRRAGQLDVLSGLAGRGIRGVWTVGFIDIVGEGKGRAVYVNCDGEVVSPRNF